MFMTFFPFEKSELNLDLFFPRKANKTYKYPTCWFSYTRLFRLLRFPVISSVLRFPATTRKALLNSSKISVPTLYQPCVPTINWQRTNFAQNLYQPCTSRVQNLCQQHLYHIGTKRVLPCNSLVHPDQICKNPVPTLYQPFTKILSSQSVPPNVGVSTQCTIYMFTLSHPCVISDMFSWTVCHTCSPIRAHYIS